MMSRNHIRGLFIPALSFSLVIIALLVSPPAAAARNARPGAGEARLLVGFSGPPTADSLSSLRSSVESFLAPIPEWEGPEMLLPNVARLRLPGEADAAGLRELLDGLPFTSFVEEDGTVKALRQPNDPRYPEQWHLPSISSPQAWDLTTGSSQVTIAVIDTGVDYSHADLSGKVVPGYNFVARNDDPMDDHGHGTHVAGIAAAASDNSLGVAGVDWKARIMPLKVLDAQGSGYDSDVAAAIRYAADNGARVINMSLGSPDYSYTLQEACNYAYNSGVTVVAASGNDGSRVGYPAACDHVIAVGALASGDNLASFSNRGNQLDLTAPGVSILSSFPGGYSKMSGTSMASPVVAGCVSLLLSNHPSYTPSQVEGVLEESATDLGDPGYDTDFGHGKVNAYGAVSGTQPPPSPDPDPGDGDWEPPSPGGEYVWYLAEGYTGSGFDTYVLVQNPNPQTADLRGEFVNTDGTYIERYYSLPGYSRLSINLDSVMPDDEVSTCISSLNEVGVVVERSMYFDYADRQGGHCSRGSPGLETDWFFAEGYTGPGFDEYLLVLNPWFSCNSLQLTLYDDQGRTETHEYWLLPASRLTIHVDQLAPDRDVSARIAAEYGVVAERAMYFDYAGRRGGHCDIGTPAPSETWFFAEGYTGPGFDEWLLLFNPGDDDRTATVTYRFTDGAETQANYIVRAGSRRSIHVNGEAPDRDVAIKVSAGGDGLFAERAMYFLYRGVWGGGHCSAGARYPCEQWNLAEGYTGCGFETWVLIQNTSSYEKAHIRIAFMGDSGIASTRAYELLPGSRTTIYLNELAAPGDVSVSLYSTNNVPVIVERAMYFNYCGLCGGSVSLGCP